MYCHPSTTSLQWDAWLCTHFQQWGDLACFEQVWEWAHWWSEAFTGFLQNKKCEGEYSSIRESRGSPTGGERSLWWSWECVCSIDLQRSWWQHWQLWRVERVFEHRPRTMPVELPVAQFSHHFFILSMSLLHTESLDHLAFNPWGLRKGLNNNKNIKIFDLSRNSWDFSSCFASF